MFKKIYNKILLKKFKKKGLQLGEGFSIIGLPRFGSEPYLISIGDYVTVAENVNFITHDGATRVFRKSLKYNKVIKYGRIVIYDNCFIGMNSILMPGITVGPNSVIAAGSIVTKDVPPNTIVGGNPAREIMSLEDYSEKSFQQTPNYDEKSYKSNKVAELIKIYPPPF